MYQNLENEREGNNTILKARRTGNLEAQRILIPQSAEGKAENQVHLHGEFSHKRAIQQIQNPIKVFITKVKENKEEIKKTIKNISQNRKGSLTAQHSE